MTRAVLLAALVVGANAFAQPQVPPIAPQSMQPGYGVVEEITPVQVRASRAGERSAAAGGSSSAPSSAPAKPAYRLKVRMPDGSVQHRDIDRPEFRPGDRVLLTNAGDVVPD
jgi:hypothetical protein